MPKLIWIDTETTGFDPADGSRLLEIACIATDEKLNLLDNGVSVVIYQPLETIKNASFHQRGDLLQAVASSTRTVSEAEKDILYYASKHNTPRTSPMCGNTISFDRKFLAAYMPDLHSWFHYRNIDVSTVKELNKLWNPYVLEPVKREAHRALPDIMESIAELKYYKEHIFR